MSAARGFLHHSDAPEPHGERTRRLLAEHPEVRELLGTNPWSMSLILGVVALQIAIAWAVGDRSWWWVFGAAYLVGAFANHSLFVLIHEAAHNLIFRRTWANLLAGMVANLPITFPSSVSFKHYHLKHHAFQGIYELDADLPSEREARLIGGSVFGKAVWLLFYPFVQGLRPLRLRGIRHWDRWIALNWVVQLAFDAAVILLLGPKAFAYMVASFFFSVGLHPLGARWIQRHYTVDGTAQETYSYYGALNKVAFNVGYHNEHHDLPSVPWNRLPAVKRTAPELYETLSSHHSWARLLVRFLFDRQITLFSRVVREDRGGRKLDAAVRPDLRPHEDPLVGTVPSERLVARASDSAAPS